MNQSPKPSEIILIVAGVLFFIFSFFSWVKVEADDDLQDIRDEIEEQIDDARDNDLPDSVIDDLEDQLDEFNENAPGGGWNAWGGQPDGADVGFPGLFPIVTLAALAGLAIAVLVAIARFTGTSLPDTVAGFTWSQLYLVGAVYAVLVSLSFAILDKSFGEEGGGLGTGIGTWLGLLASIGLVVGAVMTQREEGVGPAASGPATPPQTF